MSVLLADQVRRGSAEMGYDDEPAAAHLEAPGRRRGPRVGFTFEGDLDDVPTEAALELARVARVLTTHSDAHTGRAANARVLRLDSSLHLRWTDPECSRACLTVVLDPSELERPLASPAGDVRVMVADSPGGLQLDWMLFPSPTSMARRTWVALTRGRSRTLRPGRSEQARCRT